MRQVLSSVFADIVVAVLEDNQDERATYFSSKQVSHLQTCSVQDLDGGKCAA